MATIDSYSESNYTSRTQMGVSGVYNNVGQSFKVSFGATVKGAQAYMAKTGTPTGNITANIYAHTGTYGSSSQYTGSPLATSDTVSASSISSSNALVSFAFSGANQIVLTADTPYVLEINYTTGDASNYVLIGYDISSPTHSGNLNLNNGAQSGVDLCFYITGDTFSYSVTAGVGSFTLTGISALFKIGKTIIASSGSYAYTGTSAILKSARNIILGAGTFAITGIDALFKLGKGIFISAGSYAYNGTDVVLKSARTILLAAGTYTLTGVSINFIKGYNLVIEAGAYIYTGIAVRLRPSNIWSNISKSVTGWTNSSKNTTDWSNIDKNNATWTNSSKNATNWSNADKNDTTWSNLNKS